MTEQERWLPVVGYEDRYEVSDQGRVRALALVVAPSDGRRPYVRPAQMRKIQFDYNGYCKVSLSKDRRVECAFVHRLVLEAFVGPRPPGMEVCHNNGHKADNRPDNLRWDTKSANNLERFREHGEIPWRMFVEECPRGHLLRDPNLFESDKKLNRRGCKSCQCTHRVRDGLTWDQYLEKADAKYLSLTGLEPNFSAPGRQTKKAA